MERMEKEEGKEGRKKERKKKGRNKERKERRNEEATIQMYNTLTQMCCITDLYEILCFSS